MQCLEGHGNKVTCMRYHDGVLYSGGFDKQMIMWKNEEMDLDAC